MPRMNEQQCAMWKRRLKDAHNDEFQGWGKYTWWSGDAPTPEMRKGFKDAAKDERRHRIMVERFQNYIKTVCEDD